MSRPEFPDDLQYLCFAWGESDHPVCAIVDTPADVGRFLCKQWFGEPIETMHEGNRKQYDDAMRMVTASRWDWDAWDGTDSIEFTFEIGGIRVTRCWDVCRGEAS